MTRYKIQNKAEVFGFILFYSFLNKFFALSITRSASRSISNPLTFAKNDAIKDTFLGEFIVPRSGCGAR
jgi:hypothetical protein